MTRPGCSSLSMMATAGYSTSAGKAATTTVLSQMFSVEGRGRDMYAAAERLDLEGMVAKRVTDSYRPGTVWYKIKSRT